jgi:hypothetical protein
MSMTRNIFLNIAPEENSDKGGGVFFKPNELILFKVRGSGFLLNRSHTAQFFFQEFKDVVFQQHFAYIRTDSY